MFQLGLYTHPTTSFCLLCPSGVVMYCALSLSRVRLLATPWTIARQALLSMRILQASLPEWVAMPSSRGYSWLRDPTQVSLIAGGFFDWATRDARAPLVPPTNFNFFFSPEIKGGWSLWGHLACIPSLSSRFISEASPLPDNLSLMWHYASFSMCSLRAFRHPPSKKATLYLFPS